MKDRDKERKTLGKWRVCLKDPICVLGVIFFIIINLIIIYLFIAIIKALISF